ncbi:hypothetical protein [Sulfurovum sp. NBC37-1]|uniref:hypothetical protein n=1 Tax=Sulfurovum sp. (strain NBC37-1) TaxID=387093 RepID=UPI0001587A09|nr:hypothetical protein [Sulfurovum sp. NBC37-1]BAF72974.1 hypothetical protein SUN_2032 [Sulfurovum sp. NBC37-1]
MKIFKIVLLVLLIVSVSTKITFAKSGTLTQKQLKHYKPLKAKEGKVLKSLTDYMLSDVHLAKPVKYFDIKSYSLDKPYSGKLSRSRGSTAWSFDIKAYRKLSNKEKKEIASLHPASDGFGTTYYIDGTAGIASVYNLHYIDMNSKVHTVFSKSELVGFLGEIDTPAEMQIMLLSYPGIHRYKEKDNLYIIRTDDIYEESDGVYTHEIYHRIMNKQGSVESERVKFVQSSSRKRYKYLLKKFK